MYVNIEYLTKLLLDYLVNKVIERKYVNDLLTIVL
jgi:hypothetical protein